MCQWTPQSFLEPRTVTDATEGDDLLPMMGETKMELLAWAVWKNLIYSPKYKFDKKLNPKLSPLSMTSSQSLKILHALTYISPEPSQWWLICQLTNEHCLRQKCSHCKLGSRLKGFSSPLVMGTLPHKHTHCADINGLQMHYWPFPRQIIFFEHLCFIITWGIFATFLQIWWIGCFSAC